MKSLQKRFFILFSLLISLGVVFLVGCELPWSADSMSSTTSKTSSVGKLFSKKELQRNPGLNSIAEGKWEEAASIWNQDCAKNPISCQDLAWLRLWQLDSAKTVLDSLFLIRQTQEFMFETFELTNLNKRFDERNQELWDMALELKYPILKKVDSLLSQTVQNPELPANLLEFEKNYLSKWNSPEFDSLHHELLKFLSTNAQSVQLRDLHLRASDLQDIEEGVAPKRKMTWSRRSHEWGWP